MGSSGGVMKMAVVCMVLACMVVSSVNAQVTCGTVTSKIAPCISYVTGPAGPVPSACCAGISQLNQMAQTTPDRQAACRCLQTAAKSFPNLNPGKAAGLPAACKVNIPYPISTSTNCNTVK